MSIDSIALLAQQAYGQVSNSRTAENVQVRNDIHDAHNFHKMVQATFNNFAKMSPEQIIQHIGKSSTVSTNTNSGVVESIVGAVRTKVEKQEAAVRSSLLDEATLIELMTATNEAKNTVHMMTEIRNKMTEAFEKIMSMQI